MKKAFISYKHKDKKIVVDLINDLKEHDILPQWDGDLLPGQIWKDQIRSLINSSDYFIICFSNSYDQQYSEVNEELNLAIEKLRRFPQNVNYIIPVRLDEVSLPDFSLFGNRTLNDLHRVELFRDWDNGIKSIVQVINPKSLLFNEKKNKDQDEIQLIFKRNDSNDPVEYRDIPMNISIDREVRGEIIHGETFKYSISKGSHLIKLWYFFSKEEWSGVDADMVYSETSAKSDEIIYEFKKGRYVVHVGFAKLHRRIFGLFKADFKHSLYLKIDED